MGTLLRLSLILAAAALLAGCNAAGCTDNRTALPRAGFYDSTGQQAITVDSLAVWGVGAPGDSLLLEPQWRRQSVYLPLRPDASATRFAIAVMAGELARPSHYDTLTVRYRAAAWFVSEECGAGYRYYISSVECTGSLIERVELLDSTVTNVDAETMRLWFRTGEGAAGQ